MKYTMRRGVWIVLLLIISLLVRIGFEFFAKYLRLETTFAEFFNNVYTYVLYIIAVLIWINVVSKTEYSVSKLPWLLILIVEPFTGIFFFLTFGRDYRESLRHKKHPLTEDGRYLTHEPQTDFELAQYKEIDSEVTDIYKMAFNMTKHHAYLNDSQCDILTNGEEFFPKLIEELNKAENFILMQFYIIRTDKTGKMILDILKEKAKRGIEVKLLYDDVGSYQLNRKYMESLKNDGIEIHEIDPLYFAFFNTKVNYRNHRKTVVIDGKVGFIGGMNLANEYWYKTKRLPEFRDTHVLLTGKIVNSVTALFFRDWYYVTDNLIDDNKYFCAEKLDTECMVSIIPSGPDFKYPPIRNTYVKMINNAKKSIKIMTPYLALDHELVTSLMIASRGGVDVELIVPGVPDKKIIYEVTKSYFQELMEEGVKIYTYPKKFTHAKILIMDDMIASCGTYNLDNRSARINFEATVLMYQTGVDKLVRDFDLDRSKAKQINETKWNKRGVIDRIFSGLMGLFSPLV